MSKPVSRLDAIAADAFARIEVLKAFRDGLSDRTIEKEAMLPSGFLTKARAGANRGDRAEASWTKLVGWLATQQGASASPTPEVVAAPSLDARAGDLTLGDEIRKAETQRTLGALTTRVTADLADGRLGGPDLPWKERLKLAETLERLIARRSRVLKEERAERLEAMVQALDILTEEEEELLRAHRASVAGPPLAPGEGVPPPVDSVSEAPRPA